VYYCASRHTTPQAEGVATQVVASWLATLDRVPFVIYCCPSIHPPRHIAVAANVRHSIHVTQSVIIWVALERVGVLQRVVLGGRCRALTHSPQEICGVVEVFFAVGAVWLHRACCVKEMVGLARKARWCCGELW
jgi:hypothetical protein